MSYMYMVNQKVGRGKLGHYADADTNKTLCGISLSVGSGLVRDGDYAGHRWCSLCSLKSIVGT